jgi:hypothetical protein
MSASNSTKSPAPAGTTCFKCDRPAHRFRMRKWICTIHNRIDTMRNCARAKKKYVPTHEELWAMIQDLIARDMKCEVCQTVMQWHGKRGSLTTVSLQHDRSGKLRLICMLCNQRHDDMPGDTFYDLPPGHWPCPKCKKVLPAADYYPNKRPAYCKLCSNAISKAMWALHGKRYTANYLRKKAQRAKEKQ